MKIVVSDELINEYSKKIYSFSMSKTHNVVDAEDLSQEILMNLTNALSKEKDIENINGYIYKICFYTWSNYVRKNIEHWQVEIGDYPYEIMESIDNDQNIELITKIKKQISLLSGIHQNVLTMYYYDRYSSKQISKILNINENTVRTYLKRTKEKIKENIIMDKNQLHYKPVHINISSSGRPGKTEFDFRDDLIVQNILYVCYDYPCSIEEIATKLQVATCYLENYLNKLTELEWLKYINKKYQTNFLIHSLDDYLYTVNYHINKIGKIAQLYYDVASKYFNQFKDLIVDNDFQDNSLKYLLVSLIANYSSVNNFKYKYIKNNINTNFMIRSDGGNYYLEGFPQDLDYSDLSNDEEKWLNNIMGMNCSNTYGKYFRTLIHPTYNIKEPYLESLSYNAPYDSYSLELVHNIIKEKRIPTDVEKNVLSGYVKEEIVKIVDGIPKWNIVFLENENRLKWVELLEQMGKEIDEKIYIDYLEEYEKGYLKFIPKRFTNDMKKIYTSSINFVHPSLFYLLSNGILNKPIRSELKTACEIFRVIK